MRHSEFLAAALDAAHAAAEVVRHYYQSNLAVTLKADKSPVTEADVETEKVIRSVIEAKFPSHGFHGEETGSSGLDAEYLWVVGYDEIEMASWGAYDLTTVRQPLEEMVALAVRHLRARMRGDASPVVRDCLPNGLVIRGSTACTPMPAGLCDDLPSTKGEA